MAESAIQVSGNEVTTMDQYPYKSPEELRSTKRRCFSLRRLLWATIWAAACVAAWMVHDPAWEPKPSWSLYFLKLLGAFVAMGAFFGRPIKGALIGIVLLVAYELIVKCVFPDGSFPDFMLVPRS